MLDTRKIGPLKLCTSLKGVAQELGLNPHIQSKTGRMPVCMCPKCGDEHHLALYENFNTMKPGVIKCFKCGLQGDVINLIQESKKCNGGHAIAWLIKYNGLRVSGFQRKAFPLKLKGQGREKKTENRN